MHRAAPAARSTGFAFVRTRLSVSSVPKRIRRYGFRLWCEIWEPVLGDSTHQEHGICTRTESRIGPMHSICDCMWANRLHGVWMASWYNIVNTNMWMPTFPVFTCSSSFNNRTSGRELWCCLRDWIGFYSVDVRTGYQSRQIRKDLQRTKQVGILTSQATFDLLVIAVTLMSV